MRTSDEFMWTCSDVQQQSAAYFANGLPTSDSQKLEQHIAACSKCRLELSEAYSGYRLASAAFHAPDAVGGLNSARLGVIYAVAAGSVAMPATKPKNQLARGWFAAASALVIGAAAFMGQSAYIRVDSAPVIASAPVNAQLPEVRDAEAERSYPASYGLIYPADYRAAGGFTPDNMHATVSIDFDSLSDHSIFVYDPAYGMARTVITDGGLRPPTVPADYGVDGPKGAIRL